MATCIVVRREDFAPRRYLGVKPFMVACLCAMVVGGCGGTSSSPSSDGSSISPDSGDRTPIGIVAIGHSGLTGESSDLDRPGEPAPENSWATGTNPEVNPDRSSSSWLRRC